MNDKIKVPSILIIILIIIIWTGWYLLNKTIDNNILLKYNVTDNQTWFFNDSSWIYDDSSLYTYNMTFIDNQSNCTKLVMTYKGEHAEFYIDEFGYLHNGSLENPNNNCTWIGYYYRVDINRSAINESRRNQSEFDLLWGSWRR